MTLDLASLAQTVDQAALEGCPIPMLTADHPSLDIETAYTVQRLSMDRRYARGESLVGMKMGLTSKAKMEQMGVHEPIYGHLTGAMTLADGAAFQLAGSCHPRVEPEIAFTLGTDISGHVDRNQALAAIATVHPAMEIIDSRFTDFKFTLIDVVADNTSACAYVLGPGQAVAGLDLAALELSLDVGGREQLKGMSSAIYGHPLDSLRQLCAMLDRRGEGLQAGQTVLAGAATAAVFLQAGDKVQLDIPGLASVGFSVEA
ncbi:MAG: 4-oxalocrotonate decarboxylase [Myxococcales bacterium]|nr:4-oxalocrotonate decarboxylase [Myxococcales bacterium]